MTEKILRTIMNQRKELTEEHLLKRIEQRKAEAGGLLSDQGAAMLVAQDLHIEMQREGMEDIHVENLVTGLNDVSVIGRVMSARPLQEFKRQGGAIGRVARFQLADSTGRVGCVAWDQAAEHVTRHDLEGKIIRISHGYTREGLPGTPELHIGDKGVITIEPSGTQDEEIPNAEELLPSIEEAKRSTGEIAMVGIVKTPPRVVAFKKGDMEGRVLRTKLMDKTGRITLVAWNDKAAELEGLKKGSMIQVGNARLKTGLDGQPEIHADVRSRISILPPTAESLQVMTEALTKISQITSNRKDLDILVTALKVDPATEVARNTGEKTKVAGLLLADDTGIIRASFWDDKAELSAGLKEGDNILIEEATSREWRGEISLTVGRSSYVTVNPEGRLTETKIALTSLRDLTETSPAVAVEGIVSDQPLHRQIQTSKGETVDMTEFGLKDTSAERRVVLWRKLAQEAAKLGSGARVRITGALPRRGLTGDLELSSGPITYLDVLQTSESASTEAVAKVVELKDGSRGAVQGLIIEISNKSSASMICKNCGGKIEFENTETVCDKCGPIKDMELSATLILTIDDGTGFIEAVFPSPHSNILLDDEKEWIRRRILEQRVPRLPLSLETLSRLIGRRILVEGNVHRDSQTKSLVLHSEKVSDLHPSVRNNA